MLEEVRRRAEEFDVLHFHIDFLHGPLVRDFAGRTVTTLHGRLDLPHVVPFYHVFRELPLVAVSSDQRKYLRSANWIGTVHHGLPCDLLPFQPKVSGGYLAFLGRIAPEKRPDRAIEIAVKAGMPLKIAAKVDRVDQPYWDEKIHPMVKAKGHSHQDMKDRIESQRDHYREVPSESARRKTGTAAMTEPRDKFEQPCLNAEDKRGTVPSPNG
jgi:glycosyltransferase involved in cell wall biosynthesis